MRDLKVTLVQANQKWEAKNANLKNYEHLLSKIGGTDLILLPEMFHTGFTMNVEELFETMDDGKGINWLKEMAQKKSAAIYTSLIIKEDDNYYNRGVFIYPDGTINYYDKIKSFGLANEDKYFSPGSKSAIIEYEGWKFNLQICYDLRFPELARNKIQPNLSPSYDVLMYVANWPEKRKEHWKVLLMARAIENQCYVLGVNRVGSDNNDLTYSGDSTFINALGESSFLESNIEMCATYNMRMRELENIREILPFLKDQ